MRSSKKNGWVFLCSVFLVCGLLLFTCSGAEAVDRVSVVSGTIRVALVQQAEQVDFSVKGEYLLKDVSGKKTIAFLKPDERWQVKWQNGRLDLYRNGLPVKTLTGPLQVRENFYRLAVLSGSGELAERGLSEETVVLGANGRSVSIGEEPPRLHVLSAQGQAPLPPVKGLRLITLFNADGSRRYRGSLELRADEKGLTVINELPLEEYLYGVVPAEMPATWHEEALKAQAVAARSYALAQQGSFGDYGFDVLATENSQVYKGYDWENPATSKAVDETRGIILTYRGLPVNALFHSSSGGYTENSEEVWKERLEYIRARPDPHDLNDKHYNWQVKYSREQLIEQLNKRGYKFREVIDIVELERTSTTKRVKRVAVKGLNEQGTPVTEEICNADRVRVTLGLKSAFFTMQKEFDGQQKLVKVTFSGNGWGHGLGMSQYGALGLARKGYNYQDILKYYYSGVTISRVTEGRGENY